MVSQLFLKFPAFYETRVIITLFESVSTLSRVSSAYGFSSYFFTILFNSIFPSTLKTSWRKPH